MGRLSFFIIFISVLVLIDLYVFQAVKTVTTQKWIRISYWCITALTLLSFLSFRFINSKILFITFICLFIATYFSKIIILLFLFIDDIWRFIKWGIDTTKDLISKSDNPENKRFTLSRSDFLVKLGLGLSVVPPLAMTWGIISGAHDYRIRRKIVYSSNLPSSFDGLKILQLSDIHSGSFWNKTAVKGGVEMALSEKPDVFFFTGDLVNNEATEMKNYFDIFKTVDAPLGCYSILGNHDYGDYITWKSELEKKKNLDMLKQIHHDLGWQLLLNENKKLTVEGESIGILGIENWGAGNFSKHGDMEKTAENTKNLPFKILLSHDPSHWQTKIITDKKYQDIDLTLSGHTHGMQFGVKIGNFQWSPVQYRYKYWAGLYQEKQQYLYVNRGFGYIGYPGRIGMPPEITIIELKKS